MPDIITFTKSPSKDEAALTTMSCSLLNVRTSSVSEKDPWTMRSTQAVDLKYSSANELRKKAVKAQSGWDLLISAARRAVNLVSDTVRLG